MKSEVRGDISKKKKAVGGTVEVREMHRNIRDERLCKEEKKYKKTTTKRR